MSTVFFGGFPCTGPREAAEKCFRWHLPTDSFLGKANSYTCPLGEDPGFGTVLMKRSDFLELDLTASHSLHFAIDASEYRGLKESFSVTLKGMVVKDIVSVTPGVPDDEDETLAVYFEDERCLYRHVPMDQAYNVRRQPDGGYYEDTLNFGLPWTWTLAIESLWGHVLKLGAYPGIPIAPQGTPSNLEFWGARAWNALCQVLSRIGCSVRWNPFLGKVEIIQVGQEDADQAQALLEHSTYRVHDGYPETTVRHNVPEKVRVLFQKLPPPDHKGVSPWHIVSVADATPRDGIETGTVHDIHDDLPAIIDGEGILTNSSDITSRANERAADYFRMLHSGLDRITQLFAAPLSDTRLLPGKQIEMVRWQDLGMPGQEKNICTLVKRYENIQKVLFPRHDRQETRRVRVLTGTIDEFGFMDGYTLNWNHSDLVWETDFACFVLETNGEVLSPGDYNAQYLDIYEDLPVYTVTCCGNIPGSGSGSGSSSGPGSGSGSSGPHPPREGCGPVVRVISGQRLQYDFMDGFLTSWSGDTHEHSDFEACWVIELNDERVPPGWYVAQCLDISEGRMVYGINHCCGLGSGSGASSPGGDDEVLVSCCQEPVPEFLTAEITNKTGDCVCLPDTINLTYNGNGSWESPFYEDCTVPAQFILTCDQDTWVVELASYVGASTLVSAVCDPFEVIFDVDNAGMTQCTGTFRITFTRTV